MAVDFYRGKPHMHITVEALEAKGARCHQVSVFAAEWPEGCEVTKATLLRAAKLGLDLGWFARHFLPAPLLDEYKRQAAPLWVEYNRQVGALLDEYDRQEALLQDEYRRQLATLIWRLMEARP